MVRLAERRTPPKRARYSSTATVESRSAKKATKSRSAAKKASHAKPKEAAIHAANRLIFLPRIESLLKNLQTYSNQRKRQHGASDNVAKKLQIIHTAVGREIRKKNIINLGMAKNLNQILLSLRGVPNVPQALRHSIPKLTQFLRDNVRKDVTGFINEMKKILTPLQNDCKKLEAQLQKELKLTKKQHIQCKIDPSLKRRFNTLSNNLSKLKSMWFKHLNKISLHGNKNIQTVVKGLKRELEDLQKHVKKNLTIINRYAKPLKLRAGHKAQLLFTAEQMKNLESKWNHTQADLKKNHINCEHLCEQLKAIKLF